MVFLIEIVAWLLHRLRPPDPRVEASNGSDRVQVLGHNATAFAMTATIAEKPRRVQRV